MHGMLLALGLAAWLTPGGLAQDPAPSPPPTTPDAPEAAVPDGTWSGRSSTGQRLELVTRGNAVRSLKLGWRILFEKPCAPPGYRIPEASRSGTQFVNFQEPLKLEDGVFRAQIGIGRDLDATLEGELGARQGSGKLELRTLDSSPCTGKAEATWKVTRK